MQITLTIADQMVCQIRGVDVTRDMTKLPQAALDKIFAYGFQRLNNDAGAVGKDETSETAIAKADKKWDALVAGTIRVSSGRTADPVMKHAIGLIVGALKSALGAKAKDAKESDLRAEAKKRIAANPAILDMARKQIEEMRALGIAIEADEPDESQFLDDSDE